MNLLEGGKGGEGRVVERVETEGGWGREGGERTLGRNGGWGEREGRGGEGRGGQGRAE